MNSTDPKTFLQTLFPRDLLLPDERVVVAHPDSFISRDTGKTVDYYRQFHPRGRLPVGELATYFCVSTVEHQRKRQVKKRLEDVRTALVLAVDDCGTKSDWPDVPASYHLQTSLGNFQAGFLIEPYDVSSPAGQAYYDSLLYSLAEAGMNDPGFRSASRLARLPGSLHRTGHVADITLWEPTRIWELQELAEAFAIDLKEPRKTYALQPGKHSRLAAVNDPVYDWLVENWTIYGHNDQWVHIECPWRDTHTDGAQGPSSTSYSPDDYGRAGIGFKCQHGHCTQRTSIDFMEWILNKRNTPNV